MSYDWVTHLHRKVCKMYRESINVNTAAYGGHTKNGGVHFVYCTHTAGLHCTQYKWVEENGALFWIYMHNGRGAGYNNYRGTRITAVSDLVLVLSPSKNNLLKKIFKKISVEIFLKKERLSFPDWTNYCWQCLATEKLIFIMTKFHSH